MGSHRTYELLERLGNLLRAEERRAGQEHGLQPVHLHALSYLARCNRYSDSPAGVTTYLGVTKGTASQTLRRLQEKGLVRSKPDRDDGRRLRLALTAKGHRVLGATVPPPAFRMALDGLPQAQGEAALEELLRRLQRENDSRSFGVCRTCRYHVIKGTQAECGLTDEPLSATDAGLICREHA
ncbi:MAG: MarR family transcriptional repressor of emrRAB [Pseudohongiellaceae bacterium]